MPLVQYLLFPDHLSSPCTWREAAQPAAPRWSLADGTQQAPGTEMNFYFNYCIHNSEGQEGAQKPLMVSMATKNHLLGDSAISANLQSRPR